MAVDFTSPEAVAVSLKDTPREELIEIIVSLSVLEPLFSAAQVARRESMNVRDVRKAMNAGEIGGGYFCRGPNSKKVTASGVNAWRRRFFVAIGTGNQKNGRNGHGSK